ncbi:MAG: hypothetical protein A3B68_00895 [Candidatus Melainabacteria bacterium RIFCSPHIGHO2_02_FULL_34_12]|nr:MAG: hypothetical protein A3B68_00895 [Candidatus Melainabacteria bacterium RIFCSPHIGHO2_02_FULL_34_12]
MNRNMKLKNKENTFSEDSPFFKILLVIFVLYVILYFFRLGSVGLIDVDEPRYAEAGREMLKSGNWIVPYFNYVVRFDKPIFFYWLEAISMKIFGINEFSARFPSMLSAFISLGFLFYFVKRFYGEMIALISVLILMSSFEFVALSRFSVTDMTLATFISSSIICFFLGYEALSASHRFFKIQILQLSYFYILAFIFLALAVLTKGPVAVILVGLVMIPFFCWIGKSEYFYKSYSFWIGFVIFWILVLPWYIAVHTATGGEFTKLFFGMHNFSRYTSVVSGHRGSIFYFIPVILIGFLPWTFFLFQAIKSVLNKGLRSLLDSPKEQIPWFCLWWFVIIFIFYSISKTKLLTYVLPLFLPLSVIVAAWFDNMFKNKTDNKGLLIGLGIFFLACIVLMILCVFNLELLLPREVKSLKLDFQIISFSFLMLVGVGMAWASSRRDEKTTLLIIISTFFILYLSVVSFLMPKVDRHSQFMLRKFAKSFPSYVEIATYQIVKPSLTFYSKRQIIKYDSLTALQNRLNSPLKVAFVTKKKLLEEVSLNNSYLWGSDNRYVFYTNYPNRD